MTDVAIEKPVVEKKPNKFAMLISCLLAFPLAAVSSLFIQQLCWMSNGGYSHRALMLVMIGISGGFVHGVGFVPKHWFWKWLFSPYIAWPLMLWGYYTWFLACI